MVRSDSFCSNQSLEDSQELANSHSELEDVDFDSVFEEMERWHDILKHEDLPKMRGPRP